METGVDEGYSTYAILKTESTELYSIDDNPNAGWLVKDRKNWHLITGRTEQELQPLVNKIKNIDLVCHDSAYNKTNQYDEYKLIWQNLTNGGMFLSDDLTDAFKKFTKEKKNEIKDVFVLGRNSNRLIGVIIKK